MHVPGPCHAPCHGHVPLELGLMELQWEQLGQQLEHPLVEHVLELVLAVVRHGVVMVEARFGGYNMCHAGCLSQAWSQTSRRSISIRKL